MAKSARLTSGIYEALITESLQQQLDELKLANPHALVDRPRLQHGDVHDLLARHLAQIARTVLRELPERRKISEDGSNDESRPLDAVQHRDQRIELVNEIVAILARTSPGILEQVIRQPAEQLFAIVADARTHDSTAKPPALERPSTPLNTSALLTNSPHEPSVGQELRREMATADSVDIIVSFVRWFGVLELETAIAHCCRTRGKPIRLLTTTYMGNTERQALDKLHECGVQIRIAYESKATRLHAKAWIFRRDSGFSTGYVGSSNISHSALESGTEWNVRISERETPHLLQKFDATFESYWNSEIFEPYLPERDGDRLSEALRSRSRSPKDIDWKAFDLRPYPYQLEILEKLEVSRAVQSQNKNLVVAATGTGKTVIAALDFRRLFDDSPGMSLLFVAHRKEILEQSLTTFRAVMRDGQFGEKFVGGNRPKTWKHVFASIQSLDGHALAADDFDMVIIDEFHHAASATYSRLLQTLRPKQLLGLTATPERADGQSVLSWFDDTITAELRLWDALERKLLSPFQYFGVADTVDFSRLKWERGGYVKSEISNVLTGNDLRVGMILRSLTKYIKDVHEMRALGFCVSIEHAKYMAQSFTNAGIPALAMSSDSTAAERDSAIGRLERKEINIIFAVDLYNEGVDIPSVDTLLFLRPTESATVFLQQLGRGLRLADNKECCTVLDFIGQQSRSFRFDVRYCMLTQTSRRELSGALESGVATLPPGCHFELDSVSQHRVLAQIRASLPVRRDQFVAEIRRLENENQGLSLTKFLHESMLELGDLYRSRDWSWTELSAQASYLQPALSSEAKELLRRIPGLLHIDDYERNSFYRNILSASQPPDLSSLSVRTRRLLTMLHFGLSSRAGGCPTLDESMKILWRNPLVRQELLEVLSIVSKSPKYLAQPLSGADIPLGVHARYMREEILAAFDGLDLVNPNLPREGVWFDPKLRNDILFVTLSKTEDRFSPTTRYEDYPISRTRFHWQSQSTTSDVSATGRRYISRRPPGTTVYLFVRPTQRDERKMTMPFTFLGPVEYLEHSGSRPISIVWKLQTPMPADFFQQAKIIAG